MNDMDDSTDALNEPSPAPQREDIQVSVRNKIKNIMLWMLIFYELWRVFLFQGWRCSWFSENVWELYGTYVAKVDQTGQIKNKS